MTVEEAAMIMMSGGSTYTHEDKTITSNGIYIPDDGVRWDKVTVDVPGTFTEIFENMRTVWQGTIAGDFKLVLKTDEITPKVPPGIQVEPQHGWSYMTYGVGDKNESGNYTQFDADFVSENWRNFLFICCYKNEQFIGAWRCSVLYPYTSEYSYGATDHGATDHKERENYCSLKSFEPHKTGNAEDAITPTGSYFMSFGFKFQGTCHFDYQQVYRNSSGEITRDTTTKSQSSISDNCYLSDSNIYSDYNSRQLFEYAKQLAQAMGNWN